jgi:hypothetical protein
MGCNPVTDALDATAHARRRLVEATAVIGNRERQLLAVVIQFQVYNLLN